MEIIIYFFSIITIFLGIFLAKAIEIAILFGIPYLLINKFKKNIFKLTIKQFLAIVFSVTTLILLYKFILICITYILFFISITLGI